ncbi:uncharacterized protein [Nicotiana sylvestris]|uniref:uncharacterized protein n=1 Tax=Nicotiana sylvestris TaxID=4096 RepID=UPI00388C5F50
MKDELYRKDEQIRVLKEYLRKEHKDESIGLVKDMSEVSAQAKVAPKEGIGDGTGSNFNLARCADADYAGFLVDRKNTLELPELRRSGGKKKSEKEKEREGTCGEERGNEKRVVDHSPTADLPVPAICGVEQEKVGESYDPKKRRNLTPKAPSAPKPSKKRKASSLTTIEISLPKGRATRSRVKQSERDLQKALAESKKKYLDKGKWKVAESSEAMEAAEPSLAKRTRSTVKSKQVRISEDEEWSGKEVEDDSDGEQDKLSMFGKRKILKGRLLKDLVEPGMMRLVDALATQG